MAYDINMQGIRTSEGVKLGVVLLRNAPEDTDKVIRIRESMMREGWKGRPVVLIDAGDHHVALSGSHRLAAAQGLDDDDVKISAIALDELTAEEFEAIEEANDDEDLLAALRCIAAENNYEALAEAIEAIAAEPNLFEIEV